VSPLEKALLEARSAIGSAIGWIGGHVAFGDFEGKTLAVAKMSVEDFRSAIQSIDSALVEAGEHPDEWRQAGVPLSIVAAAKRRLGNQ
jgi:hypothetical protein